VIIVVLLPLALSAWLLHVTLAAWLLPLALSAWLLHVTLAAWLLHVTLSAWLLHVTLAAGRVLESLWWLSCVRRVVGRRVSLTTISLALLVALVLVGPSWWWRPHPCQIAGRVLESLGWGILRFRIMCRRLGLRSRRRFGGCVRVRDLDTRPRLDRNDTCT